MPRMSSRTDGTNPRAQGTNPRAQRGTPPAASSGGGVEKAGQEVATQILTPPTGNRTGTFWGVAASDKLAVGLMTDEEVFAREREDPADWEQHGSWRRKMRAGLALSNNAPRAEATHAEHVAAHAEVERAVVVPGAGSAIDSAQYAARREDRELAGDIAEELEDRLAAEKAFMASAEEAARMDRHDDDCPLRKGKECSCRANLQDLEREVLPQLERRPYRWVDQGLTRDCVMVRVDDGLEVKKQIPDPISAQNPPITITEMLPPRWVCSACAMSIRGTNIDHRCDVAVLAKARSPLALSRTLPADVRFGGAYRLVLWRDRAGEYHLGEEVVVADRVVEQRPIAGPEPYNIIEAAILDAADRNLAP